MSDFDDVIKELEAVQQQVSAALARGAVLAAEAKAKLPAELIAQIEDTPVEAILRDLITANKDQADRDREQIARLVVLIDKLNIKVDDLGAAATSVAVDLAATQSRADAVHDQPPGAAADAGIRSAQTDGVSEGT